MTDVGKIKNVSGDDRLVPSLGFRLVLAGQAVDVPLDEVFGFTQQEGTWAPHDAAAKKVHQSTLEALRELIDAEESAAVVAQTDDGPGENDGADDGAVTNNDSSEV